MMRGLYCVLVALLGFFNVTLIGSFILCEKATRSLFLRIGGGGVGYVLRTMGDLLSHG